MLLPSDMWNVYTDAGENLSEMTDLTTGFQQQHAHYRAE